MKDSQALPPSLPGGIVEGNGRGIRDEKIIGDA
jgi:hypothetical protein